MPPTVKPLARDDGLLRPRVGGHDRLGRVVAAVRRERCDGLRRRRRAAGPSAAARRSRRSRARAPAPASRPSSAAACAAVATRVGVALRAPVAAFATPELIDDRLRLGRGEVRAVELQARGLHPVAREHRAADRGRRSSGRRATSLFAWRIPASTPEATKPLAAVTLIRALRRAVALPSRRGRARGSRSGRAWPAAPLPRLSSAQMTIVVAGRAVGEHADLGRVGALHARELRARRLPAGRARPGSPAYAASRSARASASVCT